MQGNPTQLVNDHLAYVAANTDAAERTNREMDCDLDYCDYCGRCECQGATIRTLGVSPDEDHRMSGGTLHLCEHCTRHE